MAEDKSTEYKSGDQETKTRKYILYPEEIIGIALLLIVLISSLAVVVVIVMDSIGTGYFRGDLYNDLIHSRIFIFTLTIYMFSPILILIAGLMILIRFPTKLKTIVVAECVILIYILYLIQDGIMAST